MLTLEQAVSHYLASCQAQGFSSETIDGKRRHLDRFTDWCRARSLSDPREITPPVLQRYQRHVHHVRKPNGQALSLNTQHHRLSSVKLMFGWLVKHSELLYNPGSELDMPKRSTTLPRAILSPEEIERVMGQACYGLRGVRDRAILETLYATGIRRTELTRLNLEDVDRVRHSVMVRQGKNKKDRLIPISERACHWIRRYLSEQRVQQLKGEDCGSLFLNNQGKRYTPHQLSDQVRDLLDRAGIDKPGACHVFRHSMATHMLENDAELRYIQSMLGHSTIATTQIYTHVAINKLRDVYSKTHPSTQEKPVTEESR